MSRLVQFLKLYILFLLVFEFSRFYFVTYTYTKHSDSFLNIFFLTAWKGFRLDLSAAAYCMTPILIVFLLEYIFRKQFHLAVLKTIIGIEFFFIYIITLADPEFYAQWGNKFNNQVLVYLSHPKEMLLSSGAVNWVKTILFGIAMLGLLLLLLRLVYKAVEKKHAYSWQYFLLIIVTTAINFICMRGGIGVSTISQASAIFSKHSIYNAASVNSLWNAVYYIVNDTRTLYGDQHHFIATTIAENDLHYQLRNADKGIDLSSVDQPNVLIVMLESFTASGSKYFYGVNNCMPYLDAIAKDNLSFMQCYSSGDRTEKGLVCINSGYPAQTVSSIIVFPDKVNKLPGLSKSLKPLGYTNTFLYGGDAEFASMKSYLLMHEFDAVLDKKNFPSSSLKSKWGAHDAEMYAKAIETMDKTKGPFYMLCLSLSSHEPFQVPIESKDLARDNWYPYKNSLRYADKALHDFIELCKTKAWYKNTIIVLVADHGHEIGLPDTYFFGREKFHIPLVVCGGALKCELRNTRIEHVVSQTIVPSLILHSMRQDYSAFSWQSGALDSNGFAQYHFNNGFGRIHNNAECVYDNSGLSYFFKGSDSAKDSIKVKGRTFQQVLIDDFLKK